MKATTTLYFREGNSDKVYTATINGKRVTFAWGRRGAKMQTKIQDAFSNYGAETLFHQKLDEKRAKGYQMLTDNIDRAHAEQERVSIARRENIERVRARAIADRDAAQLRRDYARIEAGREAEEKLDRERAAAAAAVRPVVKTPPRTAAEMIAAMRGLRRIG